MKNGKIVQVMGPVVDVEFPDNDLPYIKDALEVDNHGKKCVMEVAQHVGNNTVDVSCCPPARDFQEIWKSLQPDLESRFL